MWQSAPMADNTHPPEPLVYHVLRKGVIAESADLAWERYRDQLAALHASTEIEAARQQGAWAAYQALIDRSRQNLARSRMPAKKIGGRHV